MRLGSIEFINSLPVDLGIVCGAVPCPASITAGTPAILNEMILKGELDISPISVFWYGKHQRDFMLLPDLSISSESGVESVILFSRFPLKDLNGKKIAFTGKGRTTPVLLEILTFFRYGFRPVLLNLDPGAEVIPEGFDAALLIGDDALYAKEKIKNTSLLAVDLAEAWQVWTGLPIVFAVWAARRDSFLKNPAAIQDTHHAILQSKKWGLSHLDEVLRFAEQKTKLPPAVLKRYLSRLSYGFDKNLENGMRLYLDYAAKCGLISPAGEFEQMTTATESRQAVGCQP